ncbi:glycine--tRNA ligase [candidate division KSB1 bacterium]|nr:MAG: glycine--tRNA ligase [candidate division KSB1 bacterium]
MEKIVSLSKRRGFIFQSSAIYGKLNACYDYGPLGVEMKRNIKDIWWKSMVQEREDIVGLDAAILMHPRVWEASGHVSGFTDPLVDCRHCKQRFREDEIDPKFLEKRQCPRCGTVGSLTEARQFNLMFKTHMGPVEESASVVYLRPETAQGIYVNFKNVIDSSRMKIPFGIAQIGKAFRNEITPGNFIFRTREFEQAEMQFFVKPGEDENFFEMWKEIRINWYSRLGIKKENLRFHQHGKDELAHYAKAAFDIEYKYPIGWKELEGIHNRTDFDLSKHQEFSNKDLSYFDDKTRERFIPYVIETSCGIDRILLTCLVDGYEEEKLENETRTVLRLDPKIAPVKAAIFPLVKKDGMPEYARKIEKDLRKSFMVFYDETGAVGRRYRRQDEAGTPFCITVDSQTLEDDTVTIRERDSMQQIRIPANGVRDELRKRIWE